MSISEKEFLRNYSIKDYERPSVTSDIVIFSIYNEPAGSNRKLGEGKLSILLIRRKEHPFKDCWALPGGFLRENETMEECALRELKEETGLKKARLLPIGSFSEPGRDPRGWIISNAYTAPVCRQNVSIKGGDDAAEAAWFTISASFDKNTNVWNLTLESQEREELVTLKAVIKQSVSRAGLTEYEILENSDLAFDHGKIIIKAFANMKRHCEADGIAYDFLPEKFTIMQLQKTHELILEQPLLAANFRRKIAPQIEETGEILEGKAFRPAMLYKLKK